MKQNINLVKIGSKNTLSYVLCQPSYYPYKEKFSVLWNDIPSHGWVAISPVNESFDASILRNLASSIALKKDSFLNLPLKVRHGKALLVSYNKTKNLNTIISVSVSDKSSKPVSFKHSFLNLPATLKSLEDQLNSSKTDLIIIDSLTGVFNIRPGDVAKLKKSMQFLERLISWYDCSIVFAYDNMSTSVSSRLNHVDWRTFIDGTKELATLSLKRKSITLP